MSYLHEIDSFRAHQLVWQLVLDGFDGSRVWNAEAAEELVGLEYLHVARDEVAQVLPDQVELVHVRLARPQRLTLQGQSSN
jgi:hypothetical protein